MDSNKAYLKKWLYIEESVRNMHNYYLFLFGYIIMTAYLHYIDLRDGNYDWAFYSWILMTFSVVWMSLITLSFPLKSRMILKEMKRRRFTLTSNH